ncbi:MAG: tRNA (adenosine(37)-N6)-threonylcarbamoyltransferase complex dimerization subunit type 1 TsaB [Candidatus Omnitrophota bacterium]
MKILAVDTSTKNLCLGLHVDGKFYEYNLQVGRNLSALLIPSVKMVIDAVGLKIADIDYFACGLGPGSFTGMRIGLAAIKGLSVVRNRPVIGISSLDVLAKNVAADDRLIVTALDARRGLVYCSSYKYEKGILKRKSEYLLLTLDEFVKKFQSKPVVLGDALALYRDKILSGLKGAVVLDKDYWVLKAHNLMELVLQKIKAKQFSSCLSIKPIYLYPKECQIKTK